MKYTTFNKEQFNVFKQPMFFGENVNVSRYDMQKHPVFEKLIEKQLSFFWRPEEIDLSQDRSDFQSLSKNEQHIFLSNLKYQTLLDSIQGRSPNIAFLPIVSLPEVETWIETWAFSETIHSRSYTYIIRNLLNDPSVVFEDIVGNKEISARANDISHYYDDLITYISIYQLHGEGIHQIKGKAIEVSLQLLKEKLYLTLVSVNVLEAIRFYVSFACSFAFAERSLMEGNAKIIKFIARDEALHLAGTQHMLQIMANGKDDPDMQKIAHKLKNQARDIFIQAAEQEKQWAKYLFHQGSMIGLNSTILEQYIEYITNQRMQTLNLEPIFEKRHNPLPWINSWLSSDQVQVAPQEVEISSYLIGQINNDVYKDEFSSFSL
jgi:ribonucleoside-diphosphate reductase beta chain